MKHIVFLALLATAGAVAAQAPAPAPAAPKPEPIKEQPLQAAPAKPAAAPEAPKAQAAKPVKHTNRRSEDARQCLDKATNTEIIKCAEEYL